jgi:hypothetical protein
MILFATSNNYFGIGTPIMVKKLCEIRTLIEGLNHGLDEIFDEGLNHGLTWASRGGVKS